MFAFRLLLVASLLAPTVAAAQPAATTASREELERFFDGLIGAQLRDKHVAGATLSFVRNGEVVLAKGYGLADVARQVPVDPDRTLFRIGSVTKLFTWTAVMQLVEEGKLDLDRDVSEYLGFQVPATFPEPITLRHLMTHTAGFEDSMVDLFSDKPEAIHELGAWVRSAMPKRVRPAGKFSAYSNYGTTLAGYIVSRVSGLSWDDYIETRILRPLGMNHTTGRQPLPKALAPDMATGYLGGGDTFEPMPWEVLTAMAPAGSMSATATDMAKFMLAHLGLGQLGDVRILQADTARKMQTQQFTHDARLPGLCLGLYEKSLAPRVIGHDGGTMLFHTMLAMFPEHGLGLFVSYNTNTAGQLPFGPTLYAFLDAFFGKPAAPRPLDQPTPASQWTGHYRPNRMNFSTWQKVIAMPSTSAVTFEDGRLVLPTPLGTFRMVEVAPLVFQDEKGRDLLTFRKDEAGRPAIALLSSVPIMAFERVPWHAAPPLHLGVLGAGQLLFLGLLLSAPIAWWRRRKRAPAEQPSSLVWARRTLLLAAAMIVTFFVVLGVLGAIDMWDLMTTPLTGISVALTFPVLGVAFIVAAAFMTVRLWLTRTASLWTRLGYTAAVTIGLLFSWSLGYWNLLGWQV